VSCAKTPNPIEMSFGMLSGMSQRNQLPDGGAHWRNLADTTEPSICGGDAAFLSNYFDRFFDIAVCIITPLETVRQLRT